MKTFEDMLNDAVNPFQHFNIDKFIREMQEFIAEGERQQRIRARKYSRYMTRIQRNPRPKKRSR